MLTDCYLPRLGGIEVQVHDLSARLRAAGHEVEIFTATPGSQGERYGTVDLVDGVAVHRLAMRLPYDLPVNPTAPPELRARLGAGGNDGRPFDVAHVHLGVVSPFAVDAARVALGAGLPSALTWHCMLARTGYAVQALGTLRRWARSGAALSAVSAVAAADVRRAAGGRERVAVLPNGIDVERWRRPPGAGPADRPVRIVTAMRLARRKRPGPLLDILARVRAAVDPSVQIEVEIYGDGPDRTRLERRLAETGMSRWVTLPGRVPREELPGRYAAAHVYVSPAQLESFGIAALEARTAGLPVVGRHGSGVAEFVTSGVNGFLAADDDDLVERLSALVSDRALRERMTAYNLAHPPEQDWGRVVAATLAEYRRAGAR